MNEILKILKYFGNFKWKLCKHPSTVSRRWAENFKKFYDNPYWQQNFEKIVGKFRAKLAKI